MPKEGNARKTDFVVCSEARAAFKRLYHGGVRNKRILAQGSGRSVKTVSHWIRMMEKGESLEANFYKPKPTKFTPNVKHSLVQILAKNPTKRAPWLARRLEERFGMKFSDGGVRKALREAGYKVKEDKRTNLTPENKQIRLLFPNTNIHTDWKRIWSFDESYFELSCSRGHCYTKPNVSHRNTARKLTNKQEKISIGIAVAISYNRKSRLCYLPRNWGPPALQHLLRTELLPDLGWDPSQRKFRSFLLDNDGRHHNRELKAYLAQEGLNKVGYLPSNSPDLNPIENVFGLMKRFVKDAMPSNEQELREAVEQAWESVTLETLRNLFDSLPHRMELVIEKNGERIPY